MRLGKIGQKNFNKNDHTLTKRTIAVSVLDITRKCAIPNKLQKELEKSDLNYVTINPGVLYEYAISLNFLFDYDKDSKVAKYTGDLDIPIYTTSLKDIGIFTAEALRHDINNRDLFIKGDVKTIREIIQLTYGNDTKLEKGKTFDEFKNNLHELLKKGVASLEEFIGILVGQLRYANLTIPFDKNGFDNHLFNNVHPVSLQDFVSKK